MIKQYVNGDLLEAFANNEFSGIVHGCNCFHTMGAGIAGAIAKAYPVALEMDKKYTDYGDWSKLGTYTTANTVNGVIINAYTQFRPGTCPRENLYESIRQVFTALNIAYPGETLGIPKIGAGIAGGEWEKIAEIIQEVTPDISIVVFYL